MFLFGIAHLSLQLRIQNIPVFLFLRMSNFVSHTLTTATTALLVATLARNRCYSII